MNITIRPAAERDIPKLLELLTGICRLHQQGRPDLFRQVGTKYNAEALRPLLSDPSRPILVAADEEDAVRGYVFGQYQVHQGETALNDLTTLYIDDFCVDEACRGQGVGRALMEKAGEVCKERGYRGLYTQGQDNNLGACRFYLKAGFRIGGLDTEVYKGTKQEGKADILFYRDV